MEANKSSSPTLNPPVFYGSAVLILLLVIYSVATATFIIAGRVSWYELGILLVGATVGGYVGGALGEKLPPALLRSFVILVGSTMTLYYFWSTYFSA